MRVIIPAAGLGSRLLPYTADRPKCLVRVGGTPIIERMLGQLRALGCSEVVCVVGHHAETLCEFVTGLSYRPDVTFIRNTRYAVTNSMASLQASFPYWDGELAIVDSDILVADRLLKMLFNATDNAMVIDPHRSVEEIDMAVEVRRGRVWHLDKALPASRTSGEFFGLSRWTTAGAAKLRETIDESVAEGGAGDWYQFAIRRLAKTMPITALYARRDEWTEIDDGDDLVAANAAHADGAAWSRR